ncbi:MAG: ROK family transcriptional regulator [Anaerolineales bacterium]|nr:ROK family transcriptional regulator [Anaerolineales bacterium]
MDALYPCYRLLNVKNLNKRVVLDIIRFTPGGISRAELARQMALTRSAISLIIDDLQREGLVHETANSSTTGGRRSILLEINPRYGHLLGIDVGASHLGIVVTDFSARVLEEREFPFAVDDGPQKCLAEVDEHVREMLADLGMEMAAIRGVGIGVPGPVVAEAGLVSAPPIMPGWDGYPIRDHLEGLWGRPVSLANDAELGALGEWAYGAGRGMQNLAYIKVGTGVGAGLLLNGQIYRGTTGSAGEIGHVTLLDGGPLCTCGNRGCLEALSGGRAIARRAGEAVRAGRRTQLAAISPEKLTARDVAAAARMGDLVAQQALTEAGQYLGIAISSLVNLFNPSMVVVGGGVSQVGDLLLEPIRKSVRERSLKSAAQAVRITTAMLGRRSSGIGAVVQAVNLALDRLIEA